jgi:phi13 family phage major tail protein
MQKIGLMGFSGIKLFPLVRNDAGGYETDEGFSLPWAQEMTRDADTSEKKIYADDMTYLTMKSWNGLNTVITLAELPLEMIARLGFGSYDEAEKTLKWNPQGRNSQFGMTFRLLRADGNYRMMKLYCFTVNEIKETGLKSKGSGAELNAYQLVGTFAVRALDGLPGELRDSAGDGDLAWLDTI